MKKVALFMAFAVFFGAATVTVSAQDKKAPVKESSKPVVQKQQKVTPAPKKEEVKPAPVTHKKDTAKAKLAPVKKQEPKKVVKPEPKKVVKPEPKKEVKPEPKK